LSSRLEEDQRAGYCRHCGERLPLIKRVKREEFCSEDHRERYLSSTQTVALNRLREMELETAPFDEPAPIAVAEEEDRFVAAALAPPPDPPMAGTIGPLAIDVPLQLATIFDGDESSIGHWEPVKPEPQWQSLALAFGLAEFTDIAPAARQQEAGAGGAVVLTDSSPAETITELAMPRNGLPLSTNMEAEAAAALEAAERESAEAEAAAAIPAPLAGPVIKEQLQSGGGLSRHSSPVPEAAEIDTTVYLPAFSPSAVIDSLGHDDSSRDNWGKTDWMWDALDVLPRDMKAPMAAEEPNQLEAAITDDFLAPPLESGCRIAPPDASAETGPFTEDGFDEAPVLEAPGSIDAGSPEKPAQPLVQVEEETESFEDFMDQIGTPGEPASQKSEERGMSEAVQSMAEAVGSRALGERIAQPFLHEPQPRAGSGKPRWMPVTISLGAAAEGTTEDWDIL